jgi:hypothetical protein
MSHRVVGPVRFGAMWNLRRHVLAVDREGKRVFEFLSERRCYHDSAEPFWERCSDVDWRTLMVLSSDLAPS